MTKTTWDGLPASTVPPFGTAVLVYRLDDPETPNLVKVLLLHRAHQGADFAGDWAWTPPTGCRFPDEPIKTCAARELYEECGLKTPIDFTANFGDDDWHMYRAEAHADVRVRLIDPEHDRFEWVDAAEAIRRCEPMAIKRPLTKAIAALQAAQK